MNPRKKSIDITTASWLLSLLHKLFTYVQISNHKSKSLVEKWHRQTRTCPATTLYIYLLEVSYILSGL